MTQQASHVSHTIERWNNRVIRYRSPRRRSAYSGPAGIPGVFGRRNRRDGRCSHDPTCHRSRRSLTHWPLGRRSGRHHSSRYQQSLICISWGAPYTECILGRAVLRDDCARSIYDHRDSAICPASGISSFTIACLQARKPGTLWVLVYPWEEAPCFSGFRPLDCAKRGSMVHCAQMC
jgi:hypothetical protein